MNICVIKLTSEKKNFPRHFKLGVFLFPNCGHAREITKVNIKRLKDKRKAHEQRESFKETEK